MEEQISQEGFQTVEEYNATQVPVNGQMELFSLQNMAVTTTISMGELQKQIKTAKEMLTDTFKNDPTYHQEEEKVKEVQKGLKVVKTTIERQPSVIAQIQKIKELNNELKEKKAAVSDYAVEVFRMSGVNEFDKDGETFDVVMTAKLVKRHQ